MKKRVLVFPCGSEIGLEIYNSVKDSLHFELFGLSSVSDHGKFVYKNYIEEIGYYTDSNFFDNLKSIIDKYKIDILYPTMDSVISIFKYNESKIGIPIIGPSSYVANICSSKKDTYDFLKNYLNVPKVYNKIDKLTFPLFVKPINGYGSRDAFKINNIEQVHHIDFDKFLLCEYLPGEEYTVDCFTGLQNQLLFVGARERSRTMNGISVNTKTSKKFTKEFKSIAEKINNLIPFKGAWFFQLKRDTNGDPCLLEIACRFAGSSSVHRIQGINFALSNLYLSVGIEPSFIINELEVELDRSLNSIYRVNIQYDTVLIDYDDTIICNGKINTTIIQFLFQSHNENKKIILITKHEGDILTSLKGYRIENIFHKIIHISKYQQKVDFIINENYKNAIFIDDSFLERKKVFEKLNIPVFSIDSVTSLIET